MSTARHYGGLAAAAVAAAALTASASLPWITRSWQSDVGLPDNTVVGIEQTADGFLWVAAKTGLARFDGVRFVTFPLMPESAPAGTVYAVCADRRGRVWVALQPGGVVCVEPGGGTTVFTQKDGLPDQLVRMLVVDAEDAVWVTYLGGEVVRIRGGKVRVFTAEEGLPGVGVCELAVDGAGRLWFSRADWIGVFREGRFCPLEQYNVERIAGARAGGLWVCAGSRLCKYTEDGSMAQARVFPAEASEKGPTVLCEDRSGRVWIGTREAGLFCYDGASFTAVPLWPQTIFSLKEDRDGNMWVGARGGGLNRVTSRLAELMTTGAGAPYDAIRSVCQDTAGMLWAVVWQKGGVVHSVGPGWMPLSGNDGWSVPNARCVTADPAGGVWIGTQNYGLHRWRNGALSESLSMTNGLADDWINVLLTTSGGEVWIGTGAPESPRHFLQQRQAGRFQTFPLPEGGGPAVALTAAPGGDCWAATAGGRLLRVRAGILTDETRSTLAGAPAIRSLLTTTDGTVWIGYGGQGLGRLKDGRFSRIRMAQGLSDDYISQMVADGCGRLWFAGNRGIFSVREKELADLAEGRAVRVCSVSYGQKDGLTSLQASYDSGSCAQRGTDGRLVFAMQTGVAIIYAAGFKESANPPPVLIERVSVNGKSAAVYGEGEALPAPPHMPGRGGTRLRLAPGPQQVEFVFTSPSFTKPEDVGFRYRMHGLDAEWVDAGVRRSVTYSLIPPGHYRFQVTACDGNGLWNATGASLDFEVQPYFWQTWWFLALAVSLTLAAVASIVRLILVRRLRRRLDYLHQQHAVERERARIARDIHDDLGTSLTKISVLADGGTADRQVPADMRASLASIRSVVREMTRAMDEIVWAINPQNDTLESMAHYLSDYAEEFLAPAGLRLRLDIPLRLPDWHLTTALRHNLFLAFKEALNNIVRHASAREAQVTLRIEADRFLLGVRDDGCGLPAAARQAVSGNGLKNLQSRMAQIGGACQVESAPGQGVSVEFEVPVSAVIRRGGHENGG